MSFPRLIEDAIARLNRAGIAYMVTGSIASSYHGEPRATLDLDIVIDPDADSLDLLVNELLADGFDVDGDVARDAFDRQGPSPWWARLLPIAPQVMSAPMSGSEPPDSGQQVRPGPTLRARRPSD